MGRNTSVASCRNGLKNKVLPSSISNRTLMHVNMHCRAMGKPQQTTCIERYNRAVRHEWLDQHIIENIPEAQDFATQWLWTYNNPSREHTSYALPGSGPPQYGHGRHNTRPETKDGRVSSTAPPR
ncbi:hypothetical protein OAN307_c44450 [Octadecabacter antarcticus 307]|uniref:Integrase catalytic domain-containing protein n=1 Tax=Octadecabacter antarcticus 307 TaxID=391626 RepID=M9R7Z5_9RHOB|nr:hypothetical protein OAN307_c32850 [Octadecabacter antarcticus 307]AGI69808.1 hypothetical protein OAN307_c44450 [Octadecabacter antarcticus 307]